MSESRVGGPGKFGHALSVWRRLELEGLYIEWLWEGRDELYGTAHGEGYRGRESQRRKAKDEKLRNIVSRLIFTQFVRFWTNGPRKERF